MSLDGYIANQHGDLDFLSVVEQSGQDYGYAKFINTVDTVIMGRKTYDKVLTFSIPFPYADEKTFIITRSHRRPQDNIVFYNDNLKALVEKLKKEEGKNIFVDGGAEIVNELIKQNLIDEFIISVIPTLIGEGVLLFKPGRPETKLELINVSYYDKGLVQLHYRRNDLDG